VFVQNRLQSCYMFLKIRKRGKKWGEHEVFEVCFVTYLGLLCYILGSLPFT
jgi:hypothetical protein